MSSVNPVGLHHVTAIASAPWQNVEFYTRVLGLRLVKRTVNFDDPGSYHLYYGDQHGSPSTLITFFPWPDVASGRQGTGLATATAFSIPDGSLGFWHERLKGLGVPVEDPRTRGEEDVLRFHDNDGMAIELVATTGDHRSGWDGVGAISAGHAVRGLHAVTLSETNLDATADMLTHRLGMTVASESGDGVRFGMAGGETGAIIDVLAGRGPRGLQAGGTVHHVAFRAPDLPTMERWHDLLEDQGVRVTQILDRQYFKSIYFREPGGVLFEIATDAPGFDVDEPLLELGKSLRLPPWLEPSRAQIEAALPPLPSLNDL